MKRIIFIIFILNLTCIFAGEFDLFKEKKKLDQSLFKDLKHNKLRLSYTLFPSDYNKIGFDLKAIEAKMSILHIMIQIHCFVSMM